MKKWYVIASMGLLCAAQSASTGVITEIGLADFSSPKVLDFETATLGAISGSAALFSDFGISSVSAVGSDFSDDFGVRNNASRSLWFDASGLKVVDPGDSGLAANEITYTIEFDSPISKFGWAWHDQEDDMLVEFFLGAVDVGSVVSGGNLVAGSSDINDKRTLFYANSDLFDTVVITNNTGFGGFSIDDFTLESTVPSPATFALLGLGLAGIGYERRKANKTT